MVSFQDIINWFQQAAVVLSSFRLVDFFDILLVAIILFYVIRLVRETRALQLFKGIILFACIYFIIKVMDMQASTYIFHSVAKNLLIIFVIVFSPEIRHILESFGRSSSSILSLFNQGAEEEQRIKIDRMITEVCRSTDTMSEKKIGALMVFERETLLGSFIETGTAVDAEVTEDLIGTVFFPKTPLHDGAAIFRESRMVAAGCILPLTKNNTLSKELGTRHRAAIGLSEECDALVVVVSEETGSISIVEKGKIERDITPSQLREYLRNGLIPDLSPTGRNIFEKIIKRLKRGNKQ